jgi:hypothetical protein
MLTVASLAMTPHTMKGARMAKKKQPKQPARKAADELEEIIDQDIISDRNLPWEDCVAQLEQLAEFCANWAEDIRNDHKDD